jgi:hypothetical protein
MGRFKQSGSPLASRRPAVLTIGAALWMSGAAGLHAAPASDIAYVEGVRGKVVAAALEGKPFLLDVLDPIEDRTQLDLQPNSELRLCHYRTRKILTLHGPQRATVAADGVTVDAGTVEDSGKTCAQPVVSTLQGGFVSRSVAMSVMAVPLDPRIRVVNRGTQRIRSMALWDEERRTKVAGFDGNMARPQLADRNSYLLVVELDDGSELKMKLRASAANEQSPLIIVVQ